MWPQALLSRFTRLAGASQAILTTSSSEAIAKGAENSLVSVLKQQQQQSGLAGVKCLLLCSEPELKFVGSPLASILRRAGLQPFLHPIRPSNAVPEPAAFRDAASVATRTGCSWMFAAGGPEILNFAKGTAATVTNGDNALKAAKKEQVGPAQGQQPPSQQQQQQQQQTWERLSCKQPSMPLISLPTSWAAFDAASTAHQVWAGPGNSATLHAHEDSQHTALFDGFLTGRLYSNPAAMRDLMALIALVTEAGLVRGNGINATDSALNAAVAGASQQTTLLLRRLLERGGRPATDEEREQDNLFAMQANIAASALHKQGRLGVLHALSTCGQQLHKLPYSVTAGALAPGVLDWLWERLEVEDTLEEEEERKEEEEEENEEDEEDGEGDEDEDEGPSPAAVAAIAARQEKVRRCTHLSRSKSLLVSTCRSVLVEGGAGKGGGGGGGGGGGASASSSDAAGNKLLTAADARFSSLWHNIFLGPLAPAASPADMEECREALAPRIRLGGDGERELLAATAELHDAALRAPVVPSKQELSTLLKGVVQG